MSIFAVRTQNISKKYSIGVLKQRHNTLRDEIAAGFKSLFSVKGRSSEVKAVSADAIWALKDVSFEVEHGEVLGVIGRNGAGKSTLLKILSRITAPTEGRAEINGRVGSLLEVGTGFHNELTGRQNIYLNGAILGMKKTEIERKFDEIVSFAEVEKFIDTPVKRYSSGMYMRLAFAVAAHLEPEVLIIDEVLAVGDLAFQNKCLGKMGDVASQGRTVLFVSHNMAAVANLCRSVMWLDQGQVVMRDAAAATISEYLKASTINQNNAGDLKGKGTGEARLTGARLLDSDGQVRDTFSMGETLVVEFDAEFFRSIPSLFMSVDIKRADTALPILHLATTDSDFNPEETPAGHHRFRVEIPNCLLYPGSYRISLYLGFQLKDLVHVEDVLNFSMIHTGYSKRTTPFYPHLGIFHAPSNWKEI